jgi:hypothetical protein
MIIQSNLTIEQWDMVNADRVQLDHGDMGQWYKRAIALQDVNVPMVQMDNFTTIKMDTIQHGPDGQLLHSSCWTISDLTIVSWTTGSMVQLDQLLHSPNRQRDYRYNRSMETTVQTDNRSIGTMEYVATMTHKNQCETRIFFDGNQKQQINRHIL